MVLALVHYPTLDRTGAVVGAAVTTLDLHDLARLSRTYGLGGVYVTTPLEGQRSLALRLLNHWVRGYGGEVNPDRREALGSLQIVGGMGDVVRDLESRWEARPCVIGTSARDGTGRLSFSEARKWVESGTGPVAVVFGTGWGLAPQALDLCDRILEPIRSEGEYNHLSVRSAASIVVDRLFGAR